MRIGRMKIHLHEVWRITDSWRDACSALRRFPEVKTLDTFNFAAADGVNATQVHAGARGVGHGAREPDLRGADQHR